MTDSGAPHRAPDDPPPRRGPSIRHALGRLRSNRAAAVTAAWWQSVRPRTRRGAVLGLVAVVGGSAVMAVALFVGASMAWSPYITTDLHPDTNARAWAAKDPVFAGAGLCAKCHETEAARLASARHAAIGCESCHGPLLEHAASSPVELASAIKPAVPTDSVCSRCHTLAIGRPGGLLQVRLADHYVPVCLQCHDPHTGVAHRPPVVLHPLENLPPCVTCHGPDGFKARSVRHPDVTGDEPCLACHAPGRGPEPGR